MRNLALILLSATALALVIGCSSSEPIVIKEPAATPPSTTAPTATAPSQPAPSTAGVSDKDLATFKADYDKAKADYTKDSKDGKKKTAYVNATVKLATGTMMADSLEPKVKYRGALELYREALKVDPTNKEALNNKELIESIYRQMGRPIPE